MKTKIQILIILFIGSFSYAAFPAPPEIYNLFILKKEGTGAVIEKLVLKEGETKIFTDPDIITYIHPFEPGSRSGQIRKNGDLISALIVSCMNGQINVTIKWPGGKLSKEPPIFISKARMVTTRVNITTSTGFKKAYRIENYETIYDDDGPVLDMYKGKAMPGDYSLVIESLEGKSEQALSGTIPYFLIKNWVTVEGEFLNGIKGRFILDLGSTESIISESVLPPNAEIRELKMVEFSTEGKKVSSASVPGATGMIKDFIGSISIPLLKMGNLEIQDVRMIVSRNFLKQLLDLGIQGILGMDVIRRTDVLTFNNLNGLIDTSGITFSAKEQVQQQYTYTIPFKIANEHIYIDGEINQIPLLFFIDSGSGESSLNKMFLSKNKINYTTIPGDKKRVMGLDGKGLEFTTIEIEKLMIEDIILENLKFRLPEESDSQTYTLDEDTGILGMDFFLHFKDIQFDFVDKVLRIK